MKIQLSFLALLIGFAALAQEAPEPPYKRFPKNVPLQLLLADSSTRFTRDDLDKKKPVMVMLFSPDCEHCKEESRALVANAAKFKHIQVVMATLAPIADMKRFYAEFGLSAVPNLVMGQDFNYQLPAYYNIKFFPFFAFYNKKKDLIGVHEGSIKMEELLAKFD